MARLAAAAGFVTTAEFFTGAIFDAWIEDCLCGFGGLLVVFERLTELFGFAYIFD